MKKETVKILNNEYFQVGLIFVIAFLNRWLYYRTGFNPGFEHRGIPFGDALEYDILAINILQGKGFGHFLYGFKYQSFIEPFYPLFLTFFYSFFGHNYSIIKIVQALIGILNCLVVYKIGKRVFNQKIGFISGLIMAFYIPYMLLNFQLMRETLFNFLFGISVLLLLETGEKPRFKKAVICGILIGLTGLTRPAGLILSIVSLLWLPFKIKERIFRAFKSGILVFSVSLLTISPWLIRNYFIHGAFIISSGGYRQFWTGANPKYGGDFYAREAWQDELWRNPSFTEIERDRRLIREGWTFIKSNPRLYLRYMHKRFDDLWAVQLPQGENKFNFVNLALLSSFCVFWFGFLGILRAGFLRRRFFIFILIFIFYSLASSVYGGLPRYRLPLEQFLVIFAGYFVYLLFNINRFDWRNLKEILAPGDKFDADSESSFFPGFKKIKKIFGVICFIVVLVFISRLSWAYFAYQPSYKTKIPEPVIIDSLKRNNLYEKWLAQDKPIEYRDIVEDQARNNGYIKETEGKIIVWFGEISYPVKTGMGEIYKFRLLLNPQPHYFGEEDVFCERAGTAKPQKTKDLKEGALITVIGRIGNKNLMPERPCVEFFDVIPVEGEIKK